MFSNVENELRSVERQIFSVIKKNKITDLNKYVSWLAKERGKKLRPALLFLVAKKCSNKKDNNDLLHAATAIELFHQSSLIHDDIIDASPKRHKELTAFKKFGSEEAIILGDWLIGLATEELSLCKNVDVRKEIGAAITSVCKGQLLQMKLRGTVITEKQYFSIIENKTAALFETSAVCGALLTNKKYSPRARRFGKDLGIAFQIIDDMEDLTGNPKKTGKPLGQDIREGEMTLPLIYLSKEISLNKNIPSIISAFKKSKSLNKTKSKAAIYLNRAKKSSFGAEELISFLFKKINID